MSDDPVKTETEPDPPIAPRPVEPIEDETVISYRTRPPSNPAAVLAMVFGVMLLVPFIGLLAIRSGRRTLVASAEQRAGREDLARRAIMLGRINIVCSILAVIALPPLIIQARRQARQVACMSQLRQIAMGVMMYANTNKNYLPDTMDKLPPFLGGGAALPTFTCPECAGDASKKPATVGTVVTSSYVYAPPAQRMSGLKNVSSLVLAYEPLTNHDGRGMGVVFCDGHVEWIEPPLAEKVFAELQAGQNPPPTLKARASAGGQ